MSTPAELDLVPLTPSLLISLPSLVCELLVRAGDEWWAHWEAIPALLPSELGPSVFCGDSPHSYSERSLSSGHAADLWTHPRWLVSNPSSTLLSWVLGTFTGSCTGREGHSWKRGLSAGFSHLCFCSLSEAVLCLVIHPFKNEIIACGLAVFSGERY